MHSIMFDDCREAYTLEPLINHKKIAGLTFRLAYRTWKKLCIHVTSKDDHRTQFSKSVAAKYLRGFKLPHSIPIEGDQFGIDNFFCLSGVSDNEIQITAEFKKYAKLSALVAVNLSWLLNTLSSIDLLSAHKERKQLFSVTTWTDLERYEHGFHFRVCVGKKCADMLEAWYNKENQEQDFPELRKMIADTCALFGLKERPENMQAHIRIKGIPMLHAGGFCACLGTSPDERFADCGYELFSHNVDTPLHQLALLVGVAALWKKLSDEQSLAVHTS